MPSQETRQFAQRAYLEGVPTGAVYVLCRGRGLSPWEAAQLAEEAAAEAHGRALAHDAFEDYRHFRNWVAVTGRNWARDQLRRRKPGPIDAATLAQPAPQDDWEENLKLLKVYMTRLPRAEAEVLRLTFLEERTLDEAADLLEPDATVSPNARRLRVMRRRDVALARLRSYYGE